MARRTRRDLVLMLGTDPTGQGGIASVAAVYLRAGLDQAMSLRYEVTHLDASVPTKLFRVFASVTSLVTLCATGRVRLVHAHVASRASFIRKSILLALARAFRIPTIFHLHGGRFREYAENDAGALTARWIRHTLKESSRVVVLTQRWREWVEGYAPSSTVITLANPVEEPPECQCEEVSERILFLGRTTEAKGIFDLLQAVSLLQKDFPALHLVIAGSGDLSAVRSYAVGHGVAARISLLGWISGQEKHEELCRAAVFVLPSHDEGLPVALLEAMVYGKAIVTTPVGGIPDAITHGEHGLLTPARQPPVLAAAIARLLRDPELRRSVGSAARQRALQRYIATAVIANLADVYREVAEV